MDIVDAPHTVPSSYLTTHLRSIQRDVSSRQALQSASQIVGVCLAQQTHFVILIQKREVSLEFVDCFCVVSGDRLKKGRALSGELRGGKRW